MRLHMPSTWIQGLGLSALLQAPGCGGAFSPYEFVMAAPDTPDMMLPVDMSSVQDMTTPRDMAVPDREYIELTNTVYYNTFATNQVDYKHSPCDPSYPKIADNELEINIPPAGSSVKSNCNIYFELDMPWSATDYLQTDLSLTVDSQIANDPEDFAKITLEYWGEKSSSAALESLDNYEILVSKIPGWQAVMRRHYRPSALSNGVIKKLRITIAVNRLGGRAAKVRIDNLNLTAKTRFPK